MSARPALSSILIKTIAVCSATLGVLVTPVAAPAQTVPADFAERVDSLLERSFEADGPGAMVVVTKDGEVIYRGARGMADVEGETPIRAETVFRYASITKQFAAATMLKLAEQGRVSLDDPLSKYLPDFPAPGSDVTLAQLLNHTSGIKSYTNIPGWMTEENTSRAYTTAELIAEFADQPADFEAGTAYSYNNSAYVLVGAVIEAVTGKPWYEAMVDEVTGAMGIPTITAFMDEASIANMATGYTRGEDEKVTLAQKIHASVPGAAGALRGTADDLIRWTEALHAGDVLKAGSLKAMTTPTALPQGKVENYGYGLGLNPLRGRSAIGHSGDIFGFATDVMHLPEERVSVAMLANSDTTSAPVSGLVARIAALAIGDPFEEFTKVETDLASLEAYFGEYAIGENDRRKFYARDGKLYTLRSGNSESEVFAAQGNRFFYGPGSLTWFEFGAEDDGRPVMRMHQNGAKEAELATYAGPIEPVVAVTVPRTTLASYAGTYATQYGKAVFTLGESDDLLLTFAGQPTTALIALDTDRFTAEGVDVTIIFAPVEGSMTMTLMQGGVTLEAERQAD
ncbi:MAG: serine hydrolase domain-containing protein [Erythrobacter sp.]|uniref:serine hydrolase domain-containing protein n=1 Tax=Erythrobacter sp. TaxID=1042 RepID=UPI002614A8A4|nr:serine hydrolase domain-containing protein [Erythrobacter sp.]MDJ0978214.1 serine hydrolase domain-containing protein [Erythrobacter sp.]